MEATFSVGASKLEEELTTRVEEEKRNGPLHTLESGKPKSTWAAYLDKRKEKRRERKQKAKSDRDKRKGGGEDDEKDDEDDDAAPDGEDGSANEADLSLLAMDGDGTDEENDRGFNLRGKKRQAKKKAAKANAN